MAKISFAVERDAKMIPMSFKKKAKLENDALRVSMNRGG